METRTQIDVVLFLEIDYVYTLNAINGILLDRLLLTTLLKT